MRMFGPWMVTQDLTATGVTLTVETYGMQINGPDAAEQERRRLARRVYELEAENARMREALEECLVQAEGCWREHYHEDSSHEAAEPRHIARARSALSPAQKGEE